MQTPVSSLDDPTHDVIVLGAGPGGEDVTSHLLRAGLSVAMVEAELVGGECFNWACVPSKAMLRPGHALRAAHRLPGARAAATPALDAAAALRFRDEAVLHHDDSAAVADFEAAGAEFVRGYGRLHGERRVLVTTASGLRELVARHAVVLATGSRAVVPSIPGLAESRPWTNRLGTSADRAPATLAVIGAGPVALELAQAWRALGAERVVVLSRGPTLLPRHEPFVGELLLEGLTRTGVEVWLGVQATSVHRGDSVELELDDGSVLHVDEVLVATGTRPTTGDLGLETVGLEPGAPVEVDEAMSSPGRSWLYAVGDVSGRAQLTHEASYHARVAGSAIAARSRGRSPCLASEADDRMIPQVVFTDPTVAAVGLTAEAAAARGIRASVREADFGTVLGAGLHAEGFIGRASIVLDDDRDVIVGATFVGQDVAEMVHAATIAIVGRVPLNRLVHAVPSFPTLSEIWLELLPIPSE